ncbi:FAD-dependent monooxygenase [Paramicrobacterium chengjingii]|uniref:FAD-dependent monooxygenase n=1 Tax=Paramicrobacterium chengjingii TaxID=2769067 RepID=A0ABX6YH13_9MICO|nr:FAD-dependent monooxygenase [Microbacterium chengjingii]QPZ38046.1 FAD-dependent monooxygenase [Microbacterium chengjingii]
MTVNDTTTTPVLIIGGSLVGLSAAVFLAWHDVPVIVIDKHTGSSQHPRAIGFTTRTIEHFRQVGIDVPASLQGMRPPGRARVQSLAGTWFEEHPWTPRGDGSYGAEFSPVTAKAITQDQLEPILRDRARELGAELRLGTELRDLVERDDGVTATVRDRQSGREYDVDAHYVIAADGGDSGVREGLGIERTGRGHLSIQRSILFRAPLEEYLQDGIVQFDIEQPELTAFLTTYSDGRWVLMLSDDIERSADEQLDLVKAAIGRNDVPVELITSGRWELSALIADRFSAGRVFLAGDSAHQLPPNRGGFGANTGIDDAHNLAWKLAAVLAGESNTDLLDTYDAERRPIALLRHDQLFARADFKAHLETGESSVPVLDDAAIELGQLYRSSSVLDADASLPSAQTPDMWKGQPGTRAPHVWVMVDGEKRSTLDLFRGRWMLLTEDDRWGDAGRNAAESLGIPMDIVRMGDEVAPVEPGAFGDAYGIDAHGAVLVRPDGYIAWRARSESTESTVALTEALRAVAAPARATTSVIG